MNQQRNVDFRYVIYLDHEPIVKAAVLADAEAVCHRYAVNSEYHGCTVRVKDSYRTDLVVFQVMGGSLLQAAEVIPFPTNKPTNE